MQQSSPQHYGFDASVKSREDDHLNRWPFAREIYGIATTGPSDWSVRIGIYGEWGMGKTSVLEFITAMAKREGHTVIPFNPWQYSTKDALWRAFVTTIYNQRIFYSMERAGWVRIKKRLQGLLTWGRIAEEGTNVFNEKVGKVVGTGIEIVKEWFSFSETDLAALRTQLGDKRVIVLIDDLDRTAPELVPEILFALKELMNVAGFSFICAFDPTVVGKVLRQYHRGFGDGLKFLEKIIDYPRWLPPPAPEGLAKLAIADATHYCAYVPEQDLRDAIKLLPPNPRSVRQFIRLLKLLGPQIHRHNQEELRWPAILAANVVKVSYPRLADALLNDIQFWHQIESIAILDRSQERAELMNSVRTHVEAKAATGNISLTAAEKETLVQIMLHLCSDISLWFGGGAEAQMYQMNIAESPRALTRKEFNSFCAAWIKIPLAKSAKTLIDEHATAVERLPVEVFRELLNTTVVAYLETLPRADGVRLDEDRTPILKQAEMLISLLECLVLALGQIDQPDKLIRADELETLFQAFADCVRTSSKTTEPFCERNEKLQIQMISRWEGDIMPLVNVIVPYGYWGPQRYDGQKGMALHQRLSDAIKPRLATQIIAGLRKSGYVQRIWPKEKEASQIRCVFLDQNSPLWKDLRTELLATIKEVDSNLAIQENIFELLHFFDYCLRERGETGDANSVKAVLQDTELLNALWLAATARPLSPRFAAALNQFLPRLKTLGLNVELPPWWAEALQNSQFNPETK